MSAGIEITVGEHTAKIYGITNRGRPAFQVSFYRAGKRQRLTFSKLAEAKSEARIALGKLASVDPEVQKLSTPVANSHRKSVKLFCESLGTLCAIAPRESLPQIAFHCRAQGNYGFGELTKKAAGVWPLIQQPWCYVSGNSVPSRSPA